MSHTTLVTFLVLFGASMRLIPHPANVAPIAAIAIFGGLYLPKRLSLMVPMIAMLVSDAIIGFYDIRMMIAVYASFLLTVYLASNVKTNKNIPMVIGATTVGAIMFFFMTNAAVWAFGTMYPHTLAGLGQSYLMALPFFRNSLLGDLFFTGILVGCMEMAYVSQKYVFAP